MLLSPEGAKASSYNVIHRSPGDCARCEVSGVARTPFAEGLFRLRGSTGAVVSPVLIPPFPFDDLVGSWNADVPPGAELVMQAQVLTPTGWSGWYTLGSRRGAEFRSPPRQEDARGHVDTDTLKLSEPATEFRYRITMAAGKSGRPVTLRLIAVAVSSGAGPAAPDPFRPGPWVRELKVAGRSQMEEQESYRHDICSPTSLSMVLDFWGRRLATVTVADRVRDRVTGMFGVWPANVALAADAGLEAMVARLPSLAELEREIAAGRPVVTSLTFGPGELSGSPLKKTRGHLLAVTGFTPEGNVIVQDPAAPDRGSARRVYDRAEFHRAWIIRKRGLAYLLWPPSRRRMSIGVPETDLLARPREMRRPKLDDANHLSQLLYGEAVTVLEARGDWARVVAEEQAHQARGGRWQGYPGWVRADSLSASEAPAWNTVVRTRQTLLQAGPDIIAVSVGTRLERVAQTKGISTVRLLDGRIAETPSDSLYVPSLRGTDADRYEAIRVAELFLGTSYYWGGRSGVQPELSIGVDCSGLTSLAFRVCGIDIPRDSHEQRLKSRPVSRKDLKQADMVFLTDSLRSPRVTHVMLYTGGDGVIESRKSSGRVLRATFTERFHQPLSTIESGDAVMDHSAAVPRRRRVYFGTYFPAVK